MIYIIVGLKHDFSRTCPKVLYIAYLIYQYLSHVLEQDRVRFFRLRSRTVKDDDGAQWITCSAIGRKRISLMSISYWVHHIVLSSPNPFDH